MVSPRATRWQNRLPHALRLRVSACTESQAHSSRIPCLLRFFIFSAVCTLAYIGGVIPHSRPAPPKPSTRYDLPGGFGRVISSDEAISTRDGISLDSSWDLRDDEVLPGVSHARLAKWRASAARSRLSAAADADTTARATPVDAARADDEASYSDRKGKREGGDELCGWPAPAAPARETEEGFQGDSVWYSTNGSKWMQHGYLEMLLAEMTGRRGVLAGIAGDESEAVCVAVYLPPHWFPCSDSPAGCQLAVWVRPASSDVALLYHLLDTRAFRFLRPSLLPHFRPSAILDAGANIGLASLIFALRFPRALIVAVEPARDNFALLQRNVKHLPRILPVNAALWSHDTRIAVTAGRREGFWACSRGNKRRRRKGGGKGGGGGGDARPPRAPKQAAEGATTPPPFQVAPPKEPRQVTGRRLGAGPQVGDGAARLGGAAGGDGASVGGAAGDIGAGAKGGDGAATEGGEAAGEGGDGAATEGGDGPQVRAATGPQLRAATGRWPLVGDGAGPQVGDGAARLGGAAGGDGASVGGAAGDIGAGAKGGDGAATEGGEAAGEGGDGAATEGGDGPQVRATTGPQLRAATGRWPLVGDGAGLQVGDGAARLGGAAGGDGASVGGAAGDIRAGAKGGDGAATEGGEAAGEGGEAAGEGGDGAATEGGDGPQVRAATGPQLRAATGRWPLVGDGAGLQVGDGAARLGGAAGGDGASVGGAAGDIRAGAKGGDGAATEGGEAAGEGGDGAATEGGDGPQVRAATGPQLRAATG
ncbi:unnamed protein product [Closterium sp. NIES-65]|nr:unnamed protein product [Closterium sp. NIES-65]